MKVFTSTLTHD